MSSAAALETAAMFGEAAKWAVLLFAGGCCAMAVHEFGHWAAAMTFGKSLKFRFQWGEIKGVKIVPRFVWDMPAGFNARQRAVTALAGFVFEIVPMSCAALYDFYSRIFRDRQFLYAYLAAAALHLALYRLYAGDSSDFKFLKKEKSE